MRSIVFNLNYRGDVSRQHGQIQPDTPLGTGLTEWLRLEPLLWCGFRTQRVNNAHPLASFPTTKFGGRKKGGGGGWKQHPSPRFWSCAKVVLLAGGMLMSLHPL